MERLRWSGVGMRLTGSIWPTADRQAPLATAGARGVWPGLDTHAHIARQPEEMDQHLAADCEMQQRNGSSLGVRNAEK